MGSAGNDAQLEEVGQAASLVVLELDVVGDGWQALIASMHSWDHRVIPMIPEMRTRSETRSASRVSLVVAPDQMGTSTSSSEKMKMVLAVRPCCQAMSGMAADR